VGPTIYSYKASNQTDIDTPLETEKNMRFYRILVLPPLICILPVVIGAVFDFNVYAGLPEAGSGLTAIHTYTDTSSDKDAVVASELLPHPILWHDPGAIAKKDLYYGHGGKESAPIGPFIFESEDRSGTNPKFDVRDSKGTKWRVKLGAEARPEVVASRLLWAVGYFANDDYVLPSAKIEGLDLTHGKSMAKGGRVINARFAKRPQGQQKIGYWKWADNPLQNTKEFNGLRVMMAVLNNWDLKDINNAVYEDKKKNYQILLASDIGATFGTNSLSWTNAHSKGNVDSYAGSGFVQHLTATYVDFATPKRPDTLLAETAGTAIKQYIMRSRMDWIGNNIPRKDARWIGGLLAQLSHKQLVDAFRAGNVAPDEIEVYVKVLERRIHELKGL
jgi:hypothetical protein